MFKGKEGHANDDGNDCLTDSLQDLSQDSQTRQEVVVLGQQWNDLLYEYTDNANFKSCLSQVSYFEVQAGAHSKKPSDAENLSQFEEHTAANRVRVFGKDSKSVTSKGGIFSKKNQRV